MKNDRFLIGILIGIGLLVVSALTLFFLRRGEVRYANENTPQGVIQDYVLALQNNDFEKAYGYLAEAQGKPEFSLFREYFISNNSSYNRAGLTFGTSSETEDSAFVTVIIQRSYGGPFNDISRNHETVDLRKQNGDWKIIRFPYPFWGYAWYEDAPKPVY